MNTQEIWSRYGQEVYLFILRNTRDKNVANDVFQNCFLKIHRNVHQLKSEQKLKAWVFQICRNEIANYYNRESSYVNTLANSPESSEENFQHICCFDKFIDDLPQDYKEVIELTYMEGKKQDEVADTLQISLANVKARIRRSKALLKKRFQECCKYKVDTKGNLVGSPDCPTCT